MTYDTTVYQYDDVQSRSILGVHGAPVIRTPSKTSAADVWPQGTILAKDQNGAVHAYKTSVTVQLGAGDGAAATLALTMGAPVQAESVIVTDGAENLTDDGFGILAGDAGGSGTVNYQTGKVSVSFNAAPADTIPVLATLDFAMAGIALEETADGVPSNTMLALGDVKREALLVDGAAPDAADLAALERINIYPVG